MQQVIDDPAKEAPLDPSEDSLEGFPLSPQQRRAWAVLEAGPRDGSLRSRLLLELRGDLQEEALAAAWEEVLARHEILRTRFARLPGMTLPVQVIDLPPALPWTEVAVSAGGRRELAEALLAADEAAGIGPEGSLLEESPRRIFRASVSQVEEGSAPLNGILISLSPLVADGRSLSNLARELAEGYGRHRRGEAGAGEEDPPMQYADYAQWISDGLEGEEGADGRDFWAACGAPPAGAASSAGASGASSWAPALALAAEPSAGEALETELRSSEALTLAALTSAASGSSLEMFSQREEVPGEILLLTACQVLLHRFSREGKPVIWGALDGRGYEELEGAIGPFRSFAPVDFSSAGGVSFRERLRQVAEAWEARVLWQEYLDADSLAASPGEAPPASEGPGSLPRTWAFEVSPRAPEAEVEGLVFRTLEQDAPSERCQLRWLVDGVDDGSEPSLGMRLVYAADSMGRAAAERLTRSLGALLEDALESPEKPIEELSLLSRAERGQILKAGQGPPVAAPGGASFLERLAEGSRPQEQQEDTVALVFGEEQLTYGELWRRAGEFSSHLRGLGLAPETRVGICLRRGSEMVSALLGILQGGFSYVALHPDHPSARLRGLLEDADPALVLCSAETAPALGEAETTDAVSPRAGAPLLKVEDIGGAPESEARRRFPIAPADPRQLAYLVYTSGSTGMPKGIEVSRGAADNYLTFLGDFLALSPDDKILQLPDLIYDASLRDLLTPLLAGARVVLASEDQSRDPGALLDLIQEHRVTALLSVVPTVLRSLVAASRERAGDWASVHTVLSSGEKLFREDVEAARSLFGPRTRLVNLYGPSECTLTSTYFEVPVDADLRDPLPIGSPIAGSSLRILDEALELRPPGLVGEACIAGEGLARGYLGDPRRTAACFLPDPFGDTAGGRLFRTGDEVVLGLRGGHEILGRRDGQIKLRGIRVEVGEIEAALRRLPGIREAAVGLHSQALGAGSLVAWVVAEDPLAGIPEEQRYTLPNGLPIRHLNRYETDFFYQQIFVDEVDVRNGLDLSPGDVVFDVGANIGLFSLYAHLAHPGIRIFAFEPIPETCSVLRSNLELYGAEARIEACGLSHQSGSVEFAYYPLSSCQSGYYPDEAQERRMLEAIIERQAENPEALSVAGEYFAGVVDQRMQRQILQCPLKTVSQVLEEQGLERIDLLKIDVEKSELDVLRGIREEDWPKIRQVSIEAHDLDGRLQEMVDLLEERGYHLTVEQEDALLDDTCLFNIYATRSAGRTRPPAKLTLPQHLVEGEVSPEALRKSLQKVLPEALVPHLFVPLAELPRTSGGKVDRRSLPDPEGLELEGGGEETREATPAEEIIRGTMASVLGLSQVGAEDDFFALGGHSLLGTQLILRINQTFRVELPLQRLFENPSPRELAARVEEAARQRLGMEIPPLVPVPRDGDLPLSFAQQRLWLVDQMEPGGSVFNLPGRCGSGELWTRGSWTGPWESWFGATRRCALLFVPGTTARRCRSSPRREIGARRASIWRPCRRECAVPRQNPSAKPPTSFPSISRPGPSSGA